MKPGTALRTGSMVSALVVLISFCHASEPRNPLEKAFAHPPDSARPWVYWFWLNGNITSNGITADLEAMKRVGIAGALIMEVDQGAPVGPADFMGTRWRGLFRHVHSEARRLGLEVNMNNDAGWNGSGGPWIKPELAMQEVVWSETNVVGPVRFETVLVQPATVAGFYRDIAVQAFPAVSGQRIPNILSKASFQRRDLHKAGQTNAALPNLIEGATVTNLTSLMRADGQLVWEVPAGHWTILRFGYTPTGVENAPAPATGRGLECDKLSREGIEAHFAGMMAKLASDNDLRPGETKPGLLATHIDSWENGSQNWTARMREEFRQRRGYDLMPFLPVLTGRVVGRAEISERFLWDIRQTVSELVIENYAGHFRELAHGAGMRFTCEAYGGPCDSIPYGGQADEPMGEFWTPSGAIETCKAMASAAHVYGKRIIGAEAFTSGDRERWLEHPALLKAHGDRAFCEGINRFVFHRYALQPWTDGRVPGMTMGPWGQHYERTQTWWDWTPAWHEYLARCQYMLRQGLFVADICYVQPEAPPQGPGNHRREGYDWDECTADAVLTRMLVKNGRIMLPDGMSYRVLVLPDTPAMTPGLLRKVKQLVSAGATILGSRPSKSPSLTDYPSCDVEVKRLADELWADCDGKAVKEHRLGAGRVVCGVAPEEFLAQSGVPADFVSEPKLRFIHRAANDMDIYFVSNYLPHDVEAVCTIRASGRVPELWWPQTARIEHAAVWQQKDGTMSIPLRLEPSGSVFVVFRDRTDGFAPVVAVTREGKSLLPTPRSAPRFIVQKAAYGVLEDPKRTRDVRAKVQALLDAGELSFQVARMAEGDDPAFLVVKTLIIEGMADGKAFKASGNDPDTLYLASAGAAPERVAQVRRGTDGKLSLEAWQPGRYEFKTASGQTGRVEIAAIPPALEVRGPWEVRFTPGWGAPEKITLDTLVDWSKHSDPGVRYFSGTATYRTSFTWQPAQSTDTNRLSAITNPQSKIELDLGKVAVMARVKVNGRDLGTLWTAPFRIDVTDVVKPGDNSLEVQVVNLWVNRLIGDERLAEDSERNPEGTLKKWPQWLQEGKPSPTGRYTFTSWRLWKNEEPLQESGLLGPVALQTSAVRLINN